MKVGRSYKQHGVTGSYDAVVIGSGIGGLAAAAMLAKHAGKRVLVLERHYTAGGFTHTFTRRGYEWDVGVHYVGQTDERTLLRRAFDEVTDGNLAWADMGDVYDRIIIGGDAYDFVKGRRRFREQMVGYFPGEAPAIDRYLDLVQRAARASHLYFAEKAVPGPIAMVAGPAMRRPLMKYTRQTTLSVLRELTKDPRLIGVLTGQYGDYGLPPAQSSFFMQALIANHYLRGGAYPVGGSAQIAATILPVIEAAGGAVLTNAEVASIVVESGRAVGVRLADGNEVRAGTVISDAGVALTFGRLLPAGEADRHGLRTALRRIEPSVAHASLYIGLRETAETLGLPRTNLWIYPDHDHDRNVARFTADPDAPLPVAYVSFPSAKDPDFERRYPGRATIEVVTLAPYAWFERWQDTRWMKRGEDYEAFKQKLTDKLLDALYTHVPQVRDRIEHAELSSPLSTQHFAGHPRGEIYGLTHSPERFEQRWLRPRTAIRGLYLTGADICTAGVGGALFGGLLTASAILGRNLVGVLARGRAAARA